jgi:hypothetical protein
MITYKSSMTKTPGDTFALLLELTDLRARRN